MLNDNPYLHQQYIRDSAMFFGRGDLLRRIYAVIAASGSISLVGPPRIGKGSVLYCARFLELQQRYGKVYADTLCRCLFVFADMHTCTYRGWESFFQELNKAIVKQCSGVIDLDNMLFDGSEGFTYLLDEIVGQDYRLVLALDSFEKLRDNERLSSPLPMFLRSEATRVSYIIASTVPLHEIFPKEPLSSPFYNIFLYRETVGVLDPANARALVNTPAQLAGQPFTAREVDWIMKQGGRHPCFLQRICLVAFDLKSADPIAPLDQDKALSLANDALYPDFITLWHTMNERQHAKLYQALDEGNMQEFYDSALFWRFVKAYCSEKISIHIENNACC